jgi:hypothetical protein
MLIHFRPPPIPRLLGIMLNYLSIGITLLSSSFCCVRSRLLFLLVAFSDAEWYVLVLGVSPTSLRSWYYDIVVSWFSR